jgi:hypothetical protein
MSRLQLEKRARQLERDLKNKDKMSGNELYIKTFEARTIQRKLNRKSRWG